MLNTVNLQNVLKENQESICKVCPWNNETHHPETICEGISCAKAFEIWKDSQWLLHGIEYD